MGRKSRGVESTVTSAVNPPQGHYQSQTPSPPPALDHHLTQTPSPRPPPKKTNNMFYFESSEE